MAWRLAQSLDTLRDELNARWPDRDKSSDGGIGDKAHAAQGSASDHNPWIIDNVGRGVVRAYDIDVDLDGSNDGNGGQALDDLREHLRALGEAGDPRLQDHGYVISNGQIASEKSRWQWVPHTKDPHFDHIHVSVARNQAGYDDTSAWLESASPIPTQHPEPSPTEDDDMRGYDPIYDDQGHKLVFARGQDDGLVLSIDDGPFAFVNPSDPGVLTSSPRATKKDNGEIVVCARGGDGACWEIDRDPSGVWQPWHSIGGKT